MVGTDLELGWGWAGFGDGLDNKPVIFLPYFIVFGGFKKEKLNWPLTW